MDRFQSCLGKTRTLTNGTRIRCATITPQGNVFVFGFDLAFGLMSVPFDTAKLQLFSILTKYSGKKITQKSNFFLCRFIIILRFKFLAKT